MNQAVRRAAAWLAGPLDQRRQQQGQDAGDENAVEGAGAADRCDRRPEALHLGKIEKIGADQRAETAADIGERRRVAERDDQATITVAIGGTKVGMAMPTPRTGVARRWMITVTQAVAMMAGIHSRFLTTR